MRWPIAAGLLPLWLCSGLAQSQPAAGEILKKVSETYKAVSQYELVVDTTEGPAGASEHAPWHMRFAFKGPNKYRMEGTLTGLGLDNPAFEEATVVHDGSTVWWYLPRVNRYASFPADDLPDASGDLGDLRPEAMDQFMLGRYREAADTASGSRLLRSETIEIGGARVACYVLSVPLGGAPPYIWWVDQKRYRILREDQGGTSALFQSIKLGEPLGDELFRFVPPEGAKKLEVH